MEENQILDDDYENPNLTRSNFQLIGMITEKVKYPDDIISKVKTEIRERKISDPEIRILKERYQKMERVEELKINYDVASLIVIFFLFLMKSIFIFFFGLSILFFSRLAIKAKFESGLLTEQKIWNLFRLGCFCLVLLVLIVAFVI